MVAKHFPTEIPEVNEFALALFENIQRVLGDQLVGFYLDGSLAYDAFDEDSDIDFVAVTRQAVDETQFNQLSLMHTAMAELDSPYAHDLEGSYISMAALRKHEPTHAPVPNLERGTTERLKWITLEEVWIIHRYYLREGGVILFGPDPATLIDPIEPAALRKAMNTWTNWLPSLLQEPSQVNSRGYQSYIVLTLCRILYTLKTGKLTSKIGAVTWVKENTDGGWDLLLDDAWVGRHHPGSPITNGALAQTMEMVKATLDYAGRVDRAVRQGMHIPSIG